MRIAGPGQAELVRVYSKFLAKLEAQLERRTSVLILQHPLFFRRRASKVGDIPILIIREFVVG